MNRFRNRAYVMLGENLFVCALTLLALGGALSIVLIGWIRAAYAPRAEVTAQPPVVELKNDRMTVLRLDFAVDGRATRPCYFTYHEDSANWRLEC